MPGITYVTDGAWGAGTGVPHTAAEADEIIYELVQEIAAIVALSPHQISNVTQSGGQVTFWLDDSSSFTVTLPVVQYTGAPVAEITTDIYQPVIGDAGTWFRCASDGTDEFTIVIATDDEVGFGIGTEMHFAQEGSATIYFVQGQNTDVTDDEVTFITVDGFDYQSRGQGAVVTAKKVAANTWHIFGGLAAVSV